MEVNDKIVFKYNGIELQYKVMHIGKYWLSNYIAGANIAIFNLLKIEDRFAFCEKEIGYDIASKTADFPEVDSLQDLEKVVNALYKEIINKSVPKYKVGDIVRIIPREGEKGDYPFVYTDIMNKYANDLFIIKEVEKISIGQLKNYINCKKYEEPFYYMLNGDPTGCTWSSKMFSKVIKADTKITADISKVNLNVIPYDTDTHTAAITCDKITCDKTIDGPSLFPEKEEPEYKLNFIVKPLNALKDV